MYSIKGLLDKLIILIKRPFILKLISITFHTWIDAPVLNHILEILELIKKQFLFWCYFYLFKIRQLTFNWILEWNNWDEWVQKECNEVDNTTQVCAIVLVLNRRNQPLRQVDVECRRRQWTISSFSPSSLVVFDVERCRATNDCVHKSDSGRELH